MCFGFRALALHTASALFLLGSPCGLLAQESETEVQTGQTPEHAFSATVDVNLVNIEVFATDRGGNPVTDLRLEDFELLVDGETAPITNFYAAAGFDDRAPAAAKAPTPPAAETASRGSSPTNGPPFHMVIYVDNFTLKPPDRNRVLRGLQRFVAQFPEPGAQMMLVSHEQSLNVRQPFTTDRFRIIDAATEVEGVTGFGIAREADRRRALDDLDAAGDEVDALAAATAYAAMLQTEMEAPLRALTDLMEPLGGLPGRKALVYVSSGLPRRVGEDLFYWIDERFPRSRARLESLHYDMTRRYRQLVTAANSAGVTFYAIDAGGLSTWESLSAAEAGASHGSFIGLDSIRRANMQGPLQEIAHDTGGYALINTNNLDLMFDRLRSDSSTFYSLAYRVGPHDEGRYRKVKVKVKRRGVQARHRDGFRVVQLQRRVEQGIQAALVFGGAASTNRFAASVVVSPAHPADAGHLRVPVEVRIPLDRITLVPADKEWIGRVQLAVQVQDIQGDLSPSARGEPMEIRIPAAEYEQALKQYVAWRVELLMRPGQQQLAVGIVDLVAGSLGFLAETLTLPPP